MTIVSCQPPTRGLAHVAVASGGVLLLVQCSVTAVATCVPLPADGIGVKLLGHVQ